MTEEFDLKKLKDSTITKMDKTLQSLDKDLQTLRTGRATPAMLEGIKVDYFGEMVPIDQVGTITTPEPRVLMITLWDKSVIVSVEAAIQMSNLGINPVVEGVKIRLPIPALTEERRKELAKKTSEFAEKAKVALRQIRKHYLDELKTAQKNKTISEDELDLETDSFEKNMKSFSDKIEQESDKKSKEIMKI